MTIQPANSTCKTWTIAEPYTQGLCVNKFFASSENEPNANCILCLAPKSDNLQDCFGCSDSIPRMWDMLTDFTIPMPNDITLSPPYTEPETDEPGVLDFNQYFPDDVTSVPLMAIPTSNSCQWGNSSWKNRWYHCRISGGARPLAPPCSYVNGDVVYVGSSSGSGLFSYTLGDLTYSTFEGGCYPVAPIEKIPGYVSLPSPAWTLYCGYLRTWTQERLCSSWWFQLKVQSGNIARLTLTVAFAHIGIYSVPVYQPTQPQNYPYSQFRYIEFDTSNHGFSFWPFGGMPVGSVGGSGSSSCYWEGPYDCFQTGKSRLLDLTLVPGSITGEVLTLPALPTNIKLRGFLT